MLAYPKTPYTDLQRTFFRMKRNFEKKQKNIAREYSKGKEGRGEQLLHNSSSLAHATFASPLLTMN